MPYWLLAFALLADISLASIKPTIIFLGSLMNYRILPALLTCAFFAACASSAPTKIGADTYYSSKTNTAGAFGDVSAVAGNLMIEGNQLCASMKKEFELVTQNTTPSAVGVRLGGASITFKCIERAGNPVMRPDNGVTTIERR